MATKSTTTPISVDGVVVGALVVARRDKKEPVYHARSKSIALRCAAPDTHAGVEDSTARASAAGAVLATSRRIDCIAQRAHAHEAQGMTMTTQRNANQRQRVTDITARALDRYMGIEAARGCRRSGRDHGS